LILFIYYNFKQYHFFSKNKNKSKRNSKQIAKMKLKKQKINQKNIQKNFQSIKTFKKKRERRKRNTDEGIEDIFQ